MWIQTTGITEKVSIKASQTITTDFVDTLAVDIGKRY